MQKSTMKRDDGETSNSGAFFPDEIRLRNRENRTKSVKYLYLDEIRQSVRCLAHEIFKFAENIHYSLKYFHRFGYLYLCFCFCRILNVFILMCLCELICVFQSA